MKGQQTFVELDSISHFPKKIYDSLAKYDVILLGEMHGTKEAPVLIRSFIDLFSQHKKVILALEIPDENQKTINQYLQSGDENIVPQIDFFNETKDGRSSEAMATLIGSLYKQQNVTLFCFDISEYKAGQAYRDSAMARNIIRMKKQNPEAVLISLSGNIHSNTKKGFRKGYETMGYYLKDVFGTKLISLNILYKSGTAYNCMNGNCQARKLEDDSSQFKDILKKQAYLLIDKGFEARGYNGIIYLKEISASPPFIPN